jgi:hypothetical protein
MCGVAPTDSGVFRPIAVAVLQLGSNKFEIDVAINQA